MATTDSGCDQKRCFLSESSATDINFPVSRRLTRQTHSNLLSLGICLYILYLSPYKISLPLLSHRYSLSGLNHIQDIYPQRDSTNIRLHNNHRTEDYNVFAQSHQLTDILSLCNVDSGTTSKCIHNDEGLPYWILLNCYISRRIGLLVVSMTSVRISECFISSIISLLTIK